MSETIEQKNIISRKLGVLKSLMAKAKKKVSGVNDYIEDKKKKGRESGLMRFVKEILIVLGGISALGILLNKTITTKLPEIEFYIKDFLKATLKEQLGCGIDTPIPQWLIDGELDLTLAYMDYTGLYHINPTSDAGRVLYSDNTSGVNSTDFNTYVHGLTTTPSTPAGWGHNSDITTNDILDIKFEPITTNGQNQLNVRPSAVYASTKTMTDLNNDFIDSLHLFPTSKMVTDIMESIFNPLSYSLNFPRDWFKNKIEITRLINKMVLVEDTKEIDESFFSFTNEEKIEMETEAYHNSEGSRMMISCDKLAGTLSVKTMTDINDAMATATTTTATYQDLKTTVDTSFNTAAKDLGDRSTIGERGRLKFEMEFFSLMFDGLFDVMANILISPKIVLLLQINNKVYYGQSEPEYKTAKEVLYENKILYTKLIDLLTTIVTSIIIKEVIKRITGITNITSAADIAEMGNNKRKQLLSLVETPTIPGVPGVPDLEIIEQLGDLL